MQLLPLFSLEFISTGTYVCFGSFIAVALVAAQLLPRERNRLTMAALWVPVVSSLALFAPLFFQLFITFISVKSIGEFRTILKEVYTSKFSADVASDILLLQSCAFFVGLSGVHFYFFSLCLSSTPKHSDKDAPLPAIREFGVLDLCLWNCGWRAPDVADIQIPAFSNTLFFGLVRFDMGATVFEYRCNDDINKIWAWFHGKSAECVSK